MDTTSVDGAHTPPKPPGLARWAKVFLAALATVPLIVMAVVIIVPVIQRMRAVRSERTGLASLKTIAAAEEDFRTNDRDGNGIADYWTADVAGLKLSPAITRADLAPRTPGPAAAHDSNWYRVLELDGERERPYGARGGEGFGFAALPAPGRYQQRVFLLNQAGIPIYRMFEEADVLEPGAPPRLTPAFAPNWPGQADRRLWRKAE